MRLGAAYQPQHSQTHRSLPAAQHVEKGREELRPGLPQLQARAQGVRRQGRDEDARHVSYARMDHARGDQRLWCAASMFSFVEEPCFI